jgi:hypothetical protein
MSQVRTRNSGRLRAPHRCRQLVIPETSNTLRVRDKAAVQWPWGRAMKTRLALCWIFTFSACTLPGLDHPGPPHITSRQTRTRACSVVADCPNGYTCEPGGARADGEQGGTCVSLPCQSNSDCGPGLTCYQGGAGIGAAAQLLPTTCPQTAEDGGTCSAFHNGMLRASRMRIAARDSPVRSTPPPCGQFLRKRPGRERASLRDGHDRAVQRGSCPCQHHVPRGQHLHLVPLE